MAFVNSNFHSLKVSVIRKVDVFTQNLFNFKVNFAILNFAILNFAISV